ncbi:hypothetical protein RISK_003843 [Rhodopirellula islandica]|uniref:Uncharacterized protein n=1 Tax=Rhodopirellula islandica TaxID=595434 RepID=A0A0J1BCB7_RHOIS|nr:hypothetical protein RISK_003843 [Rhodopirellula islandica]
MCYQIFRKRTPNSARRSGQVACLNRSAAGRMTVTRTPKKSMD